MDMRTIRAIYAIDLLNRSPAIASRLGQTGILYLPRTVLGELEFGARNSANREKNMDAIERLLKETRLLAPDRETAGVCGEIETELRRRGRPIPTNDVWIAALALQHGLPLLTRDTHFHEVEGLNVLGW
jgi:tRNA(fMet)-specific endonuclease VapC